MSVTEKKKIPRILTFDIMRGFFLIAIVIDHLNFFPNYLDWWGMRGQLLVTTAEGFFLLSGIVLGIVRGAKLIDAPFRDVTRIVLKRALQLYITYIILVIGFTLIAWYIYPDNPLVKYGVMVDHSPWQLIWQTLTLQYTYGWADYLRFYAIFIAVSPLALWLLRRGYWYVVLLVSAVVWYLSPINITTMEWELIELYQPIPWQLIFFTGLTIGFYWPQISDWWQRHKKPLTRYVAPTIIVLALTTFAWNVFAVFAQEFVNNEWTRQLSYDAWSLRLHEFHKEQLPLIRFGLFMLWFWGAFLLIEHFQKPIIKWTGWLLIPFGANSLYVYTLHALILFFVHLYFVDTVPILNFLVTISIIAAIYAAVRTKFLFRIIPR